MYRPKCSKSVKLNIEHVYTTRTYKRQTSPYEEAMSWICFLRLFNTKYRSFSLEKRFWNEKMNLLGRVRLFSKISGKIQIVAFVLFFPVPAFCPTQAQF